MPKVRSCDRWMTTVRSVPVVSTDVRHHYRESAWVVLGRKVCQTCVLGDHTAIKERVDGTCSYIFVSALLSEQKETNKVHTSQPLHIRAY